MKRPDFVPTIKYLDLSNYRFRAEKGGLKLKGFSTNVEEMLDISQMYNIGGLCLLIPLREGISETMENTSSTFVANNNITYTDDVRKEPTKHDFKGIVPEQVSLSNYFRMIIVFKLVYGQAIAIGSEGKAVDMVDVIIQLSIDMLRQLNERYTQAQLSTNEEDSAFSMRGIRNLPNGLFTAALGALELFLQTIQKLSRAMDFKNAINVDALSSNIGVSNPFAKKQDKSEGSENLEKVIKDLQNFLTENDYLKEQMFSEIGQLFLKYSTLFLTTGLVKGLNLVDSVLKNGVGVFGKDFNTIGVDNVSGKFIKFLYEFQEIMFNYVNFPMPIHISESGWVRGQPNTLKWEKTSKAGNLSYVSVSFSERRLIESTYLISSETGETNNNGGDTKDENSKTNKSAKKPLVNEVYVAQLAVNNSPQATGIVKSKEGLDFIKEDVGNSYSSYRTSKGSQYKVTDYQELVIKINTYGSNPIYANLVLFDQVPSVPTSTKVDVSLDKSDKEAVQDLIKQDNRIAKLVENLIAAIDSGSANPSDKAILSQLIHLETTPERLKLRQKYAKLNITKGVGAGNP